ncbi:MAG: V-type ATP synthase subunit E [Elusimicrobia bacterium]|nr:V-type ATP synthase subunit E [Elusimicrobiota bacterium]
MEESKKLEEILSSIEAKAAEEVNEINKAADSEIEGLKKEFGKRKTAHIESMKKKFEREGELKKRQIITEYRLTARREVLDIKQKLMDEVFNELLDRLRGLEKTRYADFMERLLGEAVSGGDVDIVPAEKESIFSKSYIDKLNKKNGWKLNLGKKTTRIEDGFILKEANSETVVDFRNISEFLRDMYAGDVAEQLFGDKSE